jgi:hypothetical protein
MELPAECGGQVASLLAYVPEITCMRTFLSFAEITRREMTGPERSVPRHVLSTRRWAHEPLTLGNHGLLATRWDIIPIENRRHAIRDVLHKSGGPMVCPVPVSVLILLQ